jgi:hypothetical protein
VIHRHQMIPLLLVNCPGFRPRYEELLSSWAPDVPGIYTEVSEFARYLADASKQGQVDDMLQTAFETLERFVTEGDAETQEVAVMGLLEDIQNLALREEFGLQAIEPSLGPLSLKAWNGLNDFWHAVHTE